MTNNNHQTLTEEQIRERATEKVFSRGQDYYSEDALVNLTRDENLIEAKCYGSMSYPYSIQVVLSEEGIKSTSCTCPYDWEGDCKHIVALLLMYLHEPERFKKKSQQQTVPLEARSKKELVRLIRTMTARYPELKTLINMPTPETVDENVKINTASIRHRLQSVLGSFHEWGDRTVEHAVRDVVGTADRFASAGDCYNAIRMYHVVLEECVKAGYPVHDQGEYFIEVEQAALGLRNCLEESATIAEDDALRQKVLHTLLDAFIWGRDYGGFDFGEDEQNPIAKYATPDDVPDLRQRIVEVQRKAAERKFSGRNVAAYEELLVQLDTLTDTSPEETLKRLRDGGMYQLLALKLLELERNDEALAVIHEHITGDLELQHLLRMLTKNGYGDLAIDVAEDLLDSAYSRRLAKWLVQRYRELDDTENEFHWLLILMKEETSSQVYPDLMTAADKLDKSEQTRTEVIRHLEKEQAFSDLTKVYLHDEAWQKAWATLERVSPSRFHHRDLALRVASQSRDACPERAIPVYEKEARRKISKRGRKNYANAARYLSDIRDMYRQIDDRESWQELIKKLREEFNNLPALQDELDKAGL